MQAEQGAALDRMVLRHSASGLDVCMENMNRIALRADVESLQNLMVSIACGGDRFS